LKGPNHTQPKAKKKKRKGKIAKLIVWLTKLSLEDQS